MKKIESLKKSFLRHKESFLNYATSIIVMTFASLPAHAASGQEDLLSKISQELSTLGSTIISIVQVGIGIVGAGLMIWAYVKRGKGEGQSNEALIGWFVGLVVALLGLQLIKQLFNYN